MKSSSGGTPLLVCTACGKPQTERGHLCEHCGAPLTPFAQTDWMLGVQSRGFAAHKATTEPRKLIVVIGTWLWMLPILTLGIFALCGSAYGLLHGEVGFGLIMGPVGLVFIWISGTILFRTTRSYWQGKSRRPETSPDAGQDEDDVAEPSECLGCGREFPAEAKCCPACGWSYSSES